jgi:hypothetical protein
MKIAALATAATLLATSAMAMDLGGGLSVGATTDASYDIDAENMNVMITPELGYSAWGANFSVDMDINIYDQEEFVLGDAFDKPVINFGVEYPIGMVNGLTAYGETSYDWDASDTVGSKVGVKFSF